MLREEARHNVHRQLPRHEKERLTKEWRVLLLLSFTERQKYPTPATRLSTRAETRPTNREQSVEEQKLLSRLRQETRQKQRPSRNSDGEPQPQSSVATSGSFSEGTDTRLSLGPLRTSTGEKKLTVRKTVVFRVYL